MLNFKTLTLTLFLISPNQLSEKVAPQKNTSQLTLEMTQFHSSANTSATAIWCPAEFFRNALEEKEKYSKEELEKAFTLFSDFNIFAVVAAKMNEGQANYEPANSISGKLRLKTSDEKELATLPETSVPAELRAYVAAIRPSLAAALGNAGKNFSFVFFPGKNSAGKRLLNPLQKEKFSLLLLDFPQPKQQIEFQWKLPFDSLLTEKTCPKCHEKCKGSWSYCPWDGSSL